MIFGEGGERLANESWLVTTSAARARGPLHYQVADAPHQTTEPLCFITGRHWRTAGGSLFIGEEGRCVALVCGTIDC